jgi:hypothetical protein
MKREEGQGVWAPARGGEDKHLPTESVFKKSKLTRERHFTNADAKY